MSDLRLFEAVGIELEYMIVDAKRLNVRTIADRLLVDRDGDPVSDLEFGPVAWSNELVNHLVELKSNGPAKSLEGLDDHFQQNVAAANKKLAAFGARLMPTAMHPWMDPDREKQLWLGDSTEIYQLLDDIFNCSGHGWANLQSTHINLPFANDDEFGRLHAAIRMVLPIIPALASSSPIHDGKKAEFADARLHYYLHHCDAIPSLVGACIPEPVFREQDYDEQILQRIYRDIAPHDPEEVLQEEFINARGAIARFSRKSIEIRVMDVQECPRADIAIVALVVEVLKSLVHEQHGSYADQQQVESGSLRAILDRTIQDGENASIDDNAYLNLLCGASVRGPLTAKDLWRHLFEKTLSTNHNIPQVSQQTLTQILQHGTLSTRILAACKGDFSPAKLKAIYTTLCDCLADNALFEPV